MKVKLVVLFSILIMVGCNEKPNNDNPRETQVIDDKPDVKFGLDVVKRNDIFDEVQLSELKADSIASETFPTDINHPEFSKGNLDKYENEVIKLQEQSKVDIANKFDIAEDELWEIISEGVERGWNDGSY